MIIQSVLSLNTFIYLTSNFLYAIDFKVFAYVAWRIVYIEISNAKCRLSVRINTSASKNYDSFYTIFIYKDEL